ncbi:tubulointerstitial nephritis antigen [Macrochelys suwanniensis]
MVRWKANNERQFWGMTLEEGFNYRLGTLPPSPTLLGMSETAIPANIWGECWGENSYFGILHGQNKCDIKKEIIATLGQLQPICK